MNHITIQGNLTRDPEAGQTGGGTPYAKFGVASKDFIAGQERVSYFDVEVYGDASAPILAHLRTGSGVCVFGTQTQQRWKDKDSGQSRSKWVVHPDRGGVVFTGGKRPADGAAAPADAPADAPVPAGVATGGTPGADEDIPF